MGKWILKDADADVARWVMGKFGVPNWRGNATAMGLCDGPELVAGVMYENWNRASVMMHVASDGSRAWLNREFLRLTFAYPFLQLRVNKALASVEGVNEPCKRFLLHLGFNLEATIEDAAPSGALLLYSIDRPAASRWFNLKVPANGKA